MPKLATRKKYSFRRNIVHLKVISEFTSIKKEDTKKEEAHEIEKENQQTQQAEAKDSSLEILNRTVEVDLDENFITEDNESIFMAIFKNENKSGGGEIEKCNYLPHLLKAYVQYKSNDVARRVVQKGLIKYTNFEFKVKPMPMPRRLSPRKEAPQKTLAQDMASLNVNIRVTFSFSKKIAYSSIKFILRF